MKTFHDQIADFITEQEKHNPRAIHEAFDFREADYREFRDALNHHNSGPGAWTLGYGAERYHTKVRKLEREKNLVAKRAFSYTNKSGSKSIATTTVVIMANMNTESKGSAKVYIFSKEHPDGMATSYSNMNGAATEANKTLRKELDASNQAYLRSQD